MNSLLSFFKSLTKGKRYFIFAVLFCCHFQIIGQVSVTLKVPPPGKFTPDDFIHLMSFNNTTGQIKQVYLTATVEERVMGLIFSGASAVFELMTGFSTPHYSTYEPIHTEHINKRYESYILQTNTLPPGNYIICVYVWDALTGDQLGKTCIPHSVFQPSAPVLVYPIDNIHLTVTQPTFIWLPPSPVPDVELAYSIKIVEILFDQTHYEAMTANPVFAEEIIITGTTWLYSLHYPSFITGQQYAWQVQAQTVDGFPIGQNDGFSEIGVFTAGKSVEHNIIPVSPTSVCIGDVDVSVMTHSVDFAWLAEGQFTSFSVIIYENPCGRYPTPPDVPTYPTPPELTPPTVPITPQPPKPPETTPTSPDSGRVLPVDSVERKPVAVVTIPGEPGDEKDFPATDTVDTGKTEEWDWPDYDEDHDYRPPLPPGWAWGPSGCYWTGEHPPKPPKLPPGWAWGPLRPYWTDERYATPDLPKEWEWEPLLPKWKGEGSAPPNREILSVITLEKPQLTPENIFEEMMFHINVPLNQILEPGQAFIYQIYGTYETPSGILHGFLSEPQCIRYSATETEKDTADPESCEVCITRMEVRVGPAMNGGLNPPKDTLEIYRDEFITLKAEGADYDELWWFCTPSPDCPETASTDMRVISGRVKFKWEITEGKGDFVELGCSGKKQATEGDRVIFMPPYVKLDTVLETKIKLSIIDDNPTQPLDSTVERLISVKIERKREEPHKYKVTIDSEEYTLPKPVQYTGLRRGTCRTGGPLWTKDEDLTTPVIRLPDVKDSDMLVYGELMRLYVDDIRDPDNVALWCISALCDTMSIKRDFEDNVEFTWSIVKGGGEFIKGNKGRYVIYQAPEKEGEVEIKVEVKNPDFYKTYDKKPDPGKITFKVYQPGVRIEQTPIDWLPEADNEIQKKSWLVYKDKGKWESALDHQCRILFVELMDISNEPGVCLNWPPKNHEEEYFVDTCKDLSIKHSDRYELFDTLKCKRWNHSDSLWYMKANTKLPQKEFTVVISSYDYGSYGFARSLANGDQSIEKPYCSVPWTKKEKQHPTRPDDTKPEAKDNRVTIPRDSDENQIADNGWQTSPQRAVSAIISHYSGRPGIQIKENDPKDPKSDLDSIPLSNYPGDGISAYEEYRGFMIRSKHERFTMSGKDLLIWDRDTVGLGYFPRSNIQCWRINKNEFDTGRVVNLNRKTHSLDFDQKGVRLYRQNDMGDVLGHAVNSVSNDGLVTCDSVLINVALHDTVGANLSNTIAHELSHAVGVRHHGEGIIEGFLAPRLPNDTVWDIVIIDGIQRFAPNDTARLNIACSGGLTSGDVNCWMRYDNYISLCPVSNALRNLNCTDHGWIANLNNRELSSVNDNVAGTSITNNRNGTGINANNQCGRNAGTNLGNCIEQIRISCRRP